LDANLGDCLEKNPVAEKEVFVAASMVVVTVSFEDDKLVALMAFDLAGWSDEY